MIIMMMIIIIIIIITRVLYGHNQSTNPSSKRCGYVAKAYTKVIIYYG